MTTGFTDPGRFLRIVDSALTALVVLSVPALATAALFPAVFLAYADLLVVLSLTIAVCYGIIRSRHRYEL